ncbi:MAG: ribonuclease D [Gammaproteobacteria bacterium]|nr:ribonuclease D [Gammaproteobacteria bacterium]
MSSSTALIESPAALEDLAGRLDGEALALDTEFLRERTYRAELCLLQLASSREAVCVDPLALADLGPLRAALCAGGPLKILHAGRQDLEVLAPVVGAIAPLFDTQIAAALAGFPAQVGYAELVRRLLDRELAKGQTRTDWSRRPLTPEQIEYALDDVRYLHALRDRLLEELARLGREHWLKEDLEGLHDPKLLVIDPDKAWQRFKGTQGWDEGRMTLLRHLAAWRERRAISKNRPRGWILDDSVLREIVQRVPRDREALAQIPEIPEGVVKHSGDEILGFVEGARIDHPPPPLPRRERPDPAFLARTKRLSHAVQAVAQELSIAPEVLATRKDLEEIARGEDAAGTLCGWRAELLADRLRAAL